MESLDFLLVIAIILLSTKVLGILSEKVHMPQVVGALLAGLFLGPSFLGILKQSEFIDQTAEIGVIILMFLAGLDTDLEELKKNGIASIIIAISGVILQFIGGALAYYYYFDVQAVDKLEVLRAIFTGVVLTATSVSITVETLREMGKLKGRMGTTILGAAIIDDILGIVILTLITSVKDSSVSTISVAAKIVQFFVFIIVIGLAIHFAKKFFEKRGETKATSRRRVAIYSLAFCFLLSYISEKFFGITDVIGAYFTGILLCNLGFKNYIEKKITVLSYLIFSPIFFASIGLKTSLQGMTGSLIIFALILLAVSMLAKVFGCFIGAKICKFDKVSAIAIGVGMVSRGEVALIVAQKGSQVGLLDTKMFPAIVLVVIVTTLITPILLKLILSKFDHKDEKSNISLKRADH